MVKHYTNQEDGELITLDCFRNVKDEAIEISSTIENFKNNSLNEIAILVRAIFQTREFEERFLKLEFHINYRRIKFYERTKQKIVLHIYDVFINLWTIYLLKIINVPKRSVGDTTIKTISNLQKIVFFRVASRKLIELKKSNLKQNRFEFITKFIGKMEI